MVATYSVLNSGQVTLGDAVFGGNFSLKAMVSADRRDLRCVKSGFNAAMACFHWPSNMIPAFPGLNKTHHCTVTAKIIGYFLVWSGVVSYMTHLFCRQFPSRSALNLLVSMIVSIRSKKQMVGVYTPWIVTTVANTHSWRNDSLHHFVDKPMGVMLNSATGNHAIACGGFAADPVVTSGCVVGDNPSDESGPYRETAFSQDGVLHAAYYTVPMRKDQ